MSLRVRAQTNKTSDGGGVYKTTKTYLDKLDASPQLPTSSFRTQYIMHPPQTLQGAQPKNS